MSKADAQSELWDRVADGYADEPVADQAAYEHKLEVTRGYLRPEMELLELGCGTGSTALAHAPHVRRVRAIDASARMIEIARARAADAGVDNVSFEHVSIDDFDAPDGTFDAVLGLSVLHLLADRSAAIAKTFRLLAPGGLFVTSTPCLRDQWRFLPLRLILPIGAALGRMPRVRFFTTEALVGGLTDAGFEIEHRWRPGKGKALFVVARKPGSSAATVPPA